MNELVAELFSSGRIIDVALACVAVEVVLLARSRRLALVDVIGQVAAGVLLLLGVRAALTGADPRVIGLLLAASFPAHLFDLSRRARAAPR